MAEDIGRIYISDAVRGKINNSDHRMTDDDVEHTCWDRSFERWIYDDERGWRLYVEGRTEYGVPAIVILYPTYDLGPEADRRPYDSGVWNLGTARRG